VRGSRTIVGLIVWFALLNLFWNWMIHDRVGSIGLMLLVGLLALYALIFLHEMSHAVVGKLVGGRIFGIQVGIGRTLFQSWIGDFLLSINLLPASGATIFGFAPQERLRLRMGLLIAAGPLLHLLFVVGFGAAIIDNGWSELSWIGQLLFILNLSLLVINLWPITKAQTMAGAISSDGKQLWQVITNQFDTNRLIESYYVTSAIFSLQKKPDLTELTELREALTHFPDNEMLNQLNIAVLLNSEQFEECIELYETIMEKPVKGKSDASEPPADTELAAQLAQRAITFNDYAWTRLLMGTERSNLETARHFSEQAFEMVPWLLPIRGTLASIKIAQHEDDDELDETIDEILEVAELFGKEKAPIFKLYRAVNLASAAMGCYKLEEEDVALDYLMQAKKLAPDEIMVKRATAIIEGPESSLAQAAVN